uniref:Reverse transcriptase domain-containing protein n=2 Tax=Nothobranchius pienaari TaxID=704102 RepID=A0A1A8LYQ6_9TELE
MVMNVEYPGIVLSDHSPVTLKLKFPEYTPPQRMWRLNSRLLADEDFKEFINSQIVFFLDLNDTSDISSGTLWESLKAYIRGQIISYSAGERKRKMKRTTELMKAIKEVDQANSMTPLEELHRKRILLQTEYDILTSQHEEDSYLRLRQVLYEHGERAGKLLSYQLKQSATAGRIVEIGDNMGNKIIDQMGINNEFKSFYEDLYTSEINDRDRVKDFFENLEILPLEAADRDRLEEPISTTEIDKAIRSMKTGKAPGPDGYPSEFYKTFAPKLIPLLCRVFMEGLDKKALPQTMSQALISVLLKKKKDPLKCESYRPVSLLGCDYKILTKVLAARIELIINKIIHPDQTGFVTGRQLSSNLRRLFNVIYTAEDNNVPEIVISLDAHKAFDRIEYYYLFMALERFGFGPTFCSWIKIIYLSPQARVRTNNIISEPFSLLRGTRQGCPLSPLLFDVAIEPLAIKLRQAAELVGIQRGTQNHRLSLYADDLLLFLSNPDISIPVALGIIKDFGGVSGYKINLDKSVLFPINKQARKLSFRAYPLAIHKDKFTYLGVNVTSKYKDLLDKNFKVTLDEAKLDMERWASLPLSLAGKINSVKMNIMPRFLYLFQTIPIFIPKSFFKELNKCTSTFIWKKTVPRIRREFLERQKEEGGLALPNYMHYYFAANIHKLLFWVKGLDEDETPIWVHMERYVASPVSLRSLVCAPLPLSKHLYTNNPVISNSLKIWTQFRLHFGNRNALLAAPIYGNHLFSPALGGTAFREWHRAGVECVKHLFKNGIFMSAAQLEKDYGISSKTNYFRYLQVRDFVKKSLSPSLELPQSGWIDELMGTDPTAKGTISTLYASIQNVASPSLDNVRRKWEEELGLDISEVDWGGAVDLVHSASVCIRHGLIQFKVLHRLHLSKEKLARMYRGSDPTCPRCKQVPANLCHMFWSCPRLKDFWANIFRTFSLIFNEDMEPMPLTAIFGVAPRETRLTASQRKAIAFTSLLARRLILFNWIKATPPSHKRWLEEVMAHLKLEHLRFTIQGNTKKIL